MRELIPNIKKYHITASTILFVQINPLVHNLKPTKGLWSIMEKRIKLEESNKQLLMDCEKGIKQEILGIINFINSINTNKPINKEKALDRNNWNMQSVRPKRYQNFRNYRHFGIESFKFTLMPQSS